MAFAQRSALSTVAPARKRRRWLPRRFLTVYLIWLAVTALIVTPEIARYDAESTRIKELAVELAGNAQSPQETAQRIAHAVRDRVALRDPTEGAPTGLGATAWSSWANGVGDVREGTRLIVKLLRARDIPASVVVLSDSRTGFRHLAVGYEADDAWRLVDGLGSSSEFRTWSEANDKPLEALVKAAPAPGGAMVYTADNPWFDRYSYFDWQSLLGDTAEVYQRVPFPGWVTAALESPPIISGLIKIAGAFGVLLVLRALWFAFVHPPRKTAA
jgi:transglutaminase-like putative cysteine protease